MSMRNAMRKLLGFAMLSLAPDEGYPNQLPENNWQAKGNVSGSWQSKREREFVINGQKVMAYSRKDAIKRLKHHKK